MSEPELFKDGVRFECQGSGKCCVSRGAYGFVYLSSQDLERLASFSGCSPEEFVERHCQMTDGFIHLRSARAECRFLKGKKCTVYEARPTQCRTWPFWPENLNAKTWSQEVASFCPGVGKGRLWSLQEIKAVAHEQTVSDNQESV